MTVSELYEIARTFHNKESYDFTPPQFAAVDLFVDYLASWIYKNEEIRT